MAFNIMDMFAAPAMNRLLQPMQTAQGVPNMLLTRPSPQNYPVAGVPAAPSIDPQTVAAVQGPAAPVAAPAGPQMAQAAPTAPASQPFFNDDRKAFLNDLFTGWAAGSTPGESLAYGAKLTAANRKDRQGRNETIDWLKSKGVNDADARQLASSPPALNEYLKRMYQGQQDNVIEINGQLVDKNTRQVVGDYRTAGDDSKPTELQRDLLAAGLKPGTPEWNEAILSKLKPKGMVVESDGQGGFRLAQGVDVAGGANLNVSQGQNSGFLLRAQDADKVIGGLNNEGTSMWNKIANKAPLGLGNYVVSDDAQKLDQAKRDFINAVLRQESGAVISPEEFANADKQYFPQPGDSEAVIQQKANNRQNAIQGFRLRSGPGAQAVDKLKQEEQSGNAADIAAAKEAIAKGAPREAVIKRLRDAGIDPEGL
ncbi:putative injection protein [Rhizobium phage RHph_Y1_10]|nr:putative injection protein [Rhizobium phage RHph_Y1_10]